MATRKTKPQSVQDILKKVSDIQQQRNEVYGDSYKHHGRLMKAFFPDGITLETEEDFSRYCLIQAMVGKLNRHIFNFYEGGHTDSTVDLTAFAAMATEYDLLQKGEKI